MAKDARHRWCLLIHTLPARPLYLRARIRRLLAESGAAPIKKAVYALPNSSAALDRLRAIATEIEAGGGSAFVCEATFPDDEVDQSVVRTYNDERRLRYREWIEEARALRSRGRTAAPADRVVRLRERLEVLRALDVFGAPGASEAAALLAHLEPGAAAGAGSKARGASDLTGLTWVTRKSVHVDRIACAWIVRRFVDPAATFRFVAAPGAPVVAGEIGFDMQGAAISHEDDGCSVETLVRRAGVKDAAVRRIAEIVHDIDLKDARYGHPETAGFEQLLLGVLASNPSDDDRIARGIDLFDALYASMSRGAALPAAGRMSFVQPPPSVRKIRRPK
jgi:hypothetical protein